MRIRVTLAVIVAACRRSASRLPLRFRTRQDGCRDRSPAKRCRPACACQGIPFGAPPVGNLRWRDHSRWRSGMAFVCQDLEQRLRQPNQPNRQPVNVTVDLPDSPKMSEDCLYLNVWTQANRANDRRPVMLWIFGGAYSEGGGSTPHNNGENLAKKGVVLVTFNYRLGIFGFYAHPELTKESPNKASGNQALADSIATLKWIKANIANFGGDPNNVTIFGESAGAAIVGMLTGSPVAKGLFHRAVTESGGWMGLGMAQMTPRERAEANAGPRGRGAGRGAPAGPPSPVPSLAELRGRSAEEIRTMGLGGGQPIIDGWIIPEDLSITFANGKQNPVDVIAGYNKDEHTSLGNNVAMRDGMAWHARIFAEKQRSSGRGVFLHVHARARPWSRSSEPESDAAAEMVYFFNNLHAPRMTRPQLSDGMESPKDRALAEQCRRPG